MEAFSLLKYWRGGAGANVRTSNTTTIATAVRRAPSETDDYEDEGPFFDMEFTVPVEEDEREEDGYEEEEGSDEMEGEGGLDFRVSSGKTLPLSPSDHLFFKGRVVSIEPSSVVFDPSKRQFPISFLRSATKFRVFLLGFKKPKPSPETNSSAQKQQSSRFFTVKMNQQHLDDAASEDGISAPEMKKLAKDVMHKYLKMIKPLYVRVSRRQGQKPRFSGQLNSLGLGFGRTRSSPAGGATASSKGEAIAPSLSNSNSQQKQGSLLVACRHLGKSRSASSAAVAAAPPLQHPHLQSQRRDDSLLQQQDGIQSAIAHCKRSFTAPKESEVVTVC
ncbi:probable membrane-associated kinase regulator 2 [Magnolia sinica]|uniref:probable membrane-associated kinase regulator 2 n=1 Tax=Magnolia sinica TaxID=86752 RepID=UPI00265B0212|nr:probable membrane-associated kinase regulator 2 [Magnolia sinica]